ncbi:site-specific DNA-methyltransferase [Mesorhizobium sp. B2-3-4]|uniref:DNA-methyltransferase n=1 Tax=Mesorhizobium sp. B2-3-4 TaxID=2589959 RepID=UPI00112BFEA9|nr:site-specific DNA-methyltransferase [Mesorhizobium sp. B2-3-4]TPM41564.1 site-specific DNA-methyltransferase [Mesorhizobium sp. B2-3-4]
MSVRILEGDCRAMLADLADGSVNCCVTSPPYFGLRDYGVDGQIGLEDTPDAFIAEMVSVFREVRRVLRDDGTLWINLGDSYAGSWGAQGHRITEGDDPSWHGSQIKNHPKRASRTGTIRQEGLKPKDLIGIPWMVAFALRADGWYLRQDIIWHKPNPMPESVTDRCTKAHEYLFLLTKSQRYYFNAEAIAEERTSDEDSSTFRGGAYVGGAIDNGTMGKRAVPGNVKRPQAQRAAQLAEQHGLTDAHIAAIRSVGITDAGKARVTQDGTGKNDPVVQALADEAKAVLGGYYREFLISAKRNKRSVWTVATQPFKEAHFATFPPELIDPCIKAGCPVGGTVLDPFGGAGTTGLVADRLQRNAILIELNPAYADIARRRIAADAGLFGAVA